MLLQSVLTLVPQLSTALLAPTSEIPTLVNYRISVSALTNMHSPRSADQMADKPPSTDNSTPFTKLESSEARNSATVAISSG
jgi:hypothetical protein